MLVDEHFEKGDRMLTPPGYHDYLSTVERMSADQRAYYVWFVDQLRAGFAPHVGDNLSYVHVSLKGRIRQAVPRGTVVV